MLVLLVPVLVLLVATSLSPAEGRLYVEMHTLKIGDENASIEVRLDTDQSVYAFQLLDVGPDRTEDDLE